MTVPRIPSMDKLIKSMLRRGSNIPERKAQLEHLLEMCVNGREEEVVAPTGQVLYIKKYYLDLAFKIIQHLDKMELDVIKEAIKVNGDTKEFNFKVTVEEPEQLEGGCDE